MKNKSDFIRELSDDELKDRINEETEQFVKVKMNHAVSQIENPMKIREARKFLARLKTEQKARSIKAGKIN